ncbi:type II toxin-antitoxin system VapC family toxin [Thermococcus barophilus]|uniref:Ribonuclease VapC n=1 Tax=Thermococcus barophilus TaxID=55802 RepID=A0A0S1X8B6_THEBA|nr:type II toxin-antitoxin system VapC family toxin [Thermococcus barophilus]ALM74012.1 putative ribonuclease VapC6 [Thermococcus barophilus]
MNHSEVFVDSSVLVGLNLGDEKAKALVKSLIERGFILVINPVVFSETAYKVMFTLALRDGLKGVYDLKKHLGRYAWVYGKVKESIEQLIKNELLRVVEVNWEILKLSAEIGEKYALLTNDAIIVATCKYYGIQRIATFDEDFKKVDFLEVVDSPL